MSSGTRCSELFESFLTAFESQNACTGSSEFTMDCIRFSIFGRFMGERGSSSSGDWLAVEVLPVQCTTAGSSTSVRARPFVRRFLSESACATASSSSKRIAWSVVVSVESTSRVRIVGIGRSPLSASVPMRGTDRLRRGNNATQHPLCFDVFFSSRLVFTTLYSNPGEASKSHAVSTPALANASWGVRCQGMSSTCRRKRASISVRQAPRVSRGTSTKRTPRRNKTLDMLFSRLGQRDSERKHIGKTVGEKRVLLVTERDPS